MSATDFRALRIQLVVHAGGGLLVLLAATVLSVYQPWGMTPYGRRTQHERRNVSLAYRPTHPESDLGPGLGFATRTPRWVYVIGIHAIGLVVLFVVLHLASGGMRGH